MVSLPSSAMKIRLRNPEREVELAGPLPVRTVLDRLAVHADSVIVIRDCELLVSDDVVGDDDVVELRPVISGGGR